MSESGCHLKNVYGHCLVGVQVAESRTDKSGYTTGLPGRFVRGSSNFGFKNPYVYSHSAIKKNVLRKFAFLSVWRCRRDRTTGYWRSRCYVTATGFVSEFVIKVCESYQTHKFKSQPTGR